jgi:transcriptional regulator with XRE-family HTH domain
LGCDARPEYSHVAARHWSQTLVRRPLSSGSVTIPPGIHSVHGQVSDSMNSRTLEGTTGQRPVGELLREWREIRRVSQLNLGLDADVSARHISFIETGRSTPSRAMVLRLAHCLDIPLRERNLLLISAGFAPVYPESSLDDPELGAIAQAIDMVLRGHEPYPAIAIDRHWNLVSANRAVPLLLEDVEQEVLTPPVNVLRLSLHPDGLARRAIELDQWRAHLFALLRRQIARTADPFLRELLDELRSYPGGSDVSLADPPVRSNVAGGLVIPFRIQTSLGVLSFFSTTTVFGTASDVTISELAIESFFPADEQTAQALRSAALPPPAGL